MPLLLRSYMVFATNEATASTELHADQLTAIDKLGSIFLPAITGQLPVSRHQRILLSVPAKLGGLEFILQSLLSKQQQRIVP